MMVPPRRPLRDNPRLILAGMIFLLAALVTRVRRRATRSGVTISALVTEALTEFL